MADLTRFDRVLLAVAPALALRRLGARLRAGLALRYYDAASTGRRTEGWRRLGGDGNAATQRGLNTRNTARDLVRNNAWARAAVATIVDHVIGWGIQPKTPTGAFGQFGTAWKAWAETPACDLEGRRDLHGLARLVLETVVVAGECLVRRRVLEGEAFPLKLQVLEPDYLDESRDQEIPGGSIVQGIEYNDRGARVAYWLLPEHPGAQRTGSMRGSNFQQSVRIPASEILHVALPERPEQQRGVSWFAPVMLRLKDLDDYLDAALMKQKVAACLSVIITDSSGIGTPLGTGDDTLSPGIDSLQPGLIARFAAGDTAQVVQPPSVSEHGAYTKSVLQEIASGLGVTYEDLTGDFCVAPETRILTADLRWVRADSLRTGDPIIAFDEEAPGGQGQRRKWRRAEVVRSIQRPLHRMRVTTDRASVVVSDEHRFLITGRPGLSGRKGRGQVWARADELKPGDRIVFLAEPWETGLTYDHGYLKGIADGEGYIDPKDAKIGIAQNPGLVCAEIGEALRLLGFKAQEKTANGLHKVRQWQIMGIANVLRFLGEVRPTRLLAKAHLAYEGRMLSGGYKKQDISNHATVLSVEPDGVGPVVTLETSTHTLIAEGLCTHNSQVNFSSARMSRIKHWDRVHCWRWSMMVPQFYAGVWMWAAQMAAAMNLRIPATPTTWTPPPMPMIEPDKEGLAYARNIRAGIQTHSDVWRELGYDRATFLEEYQEDLKELDRRKIILDSDARQTTQAGQLQGKALPEEPTPEPVVAAPNPESERAIAGVRERVDQAFDALSRELATLTNGNGHKAPDIHVNVQAPPAPQVNVDARTKVEPGAVVANVQAAPAPSVTVQGDQITLPEIVLPDIHVDARTTVAEGAVKAGDVLVEAPAIHVAAPEIRLPEGLVQTKTEIPVTIAKTVKVPAGRKRVKRDPKGRIAEIVDEGTPERLVVERLERDADGQLTGIDTPADDGA